jgi:hypothetical protein
MANPLSKIANTIIKKIQEAGTSVEHKKKIQMDEQTVGSMSEAMKRMDGERQAAKAELQKRRKKEKAEEQQQDKEDISRYLNKQNKELSRKNLENNVSLRKLLTSNKDIEIISRQGGTSYGHVKDLVPDEKGTLYLISDEEGIVMAGPTLGRIFANPKKMQKELKKGMVTVNLNDKGQYMQGPETVEVPKMIWTKDEKWAVADDATEKYMEEVPQLRQQINQLRGEKAMMERAMVSMAEEIREQDRMLETSEEISESIKEQLEKRNDEMMETLYQFDDMQRNMKRMSMNVDTWEDAAKSVIQNRDKMVQEMVKDIDMDEKDVAKEELQSTLQFLLGNADELMQMAQAGDMNPAAQQQPQAEQPGAEVIESNEQS